MSAQEQLTTLELKIQAVEEEIKEASRELASVVEQLKLKLSDPERVELLDDKRRRVTEIEQLRTEKLALLANMPELLRHKTIALENQQRGAEPPPFFQMTKWLGLREIFHAVASCCYFIKICSV